MSKKALEKRAISKACNACGDMMLLDYEAEPKSPRWKIPDGLRSTCESCEKILENPLAAWALKVARNAAENARREHEDDKNHYTIS